MFQKYMKDAFIVNYTITLIRTFFKKHQCGFCNDRMALVSACTSSHDRKKNCP